METFYGYYGNVWDRLKPPKKMDKGECFHCVLTGFHDVPFLKRLQFAYAFEVASFAGVVRCLVFNGDLSHCL